MPTTSGGCPRRARTPLLVAAFIASVALALLAAFSLQTAVAHAATFSDVTEGDWFYEAVESLAAEGALGGYSDGTFRPHNPVTRAQFAVMMAGVMHLEPGDGSVFIDVSGSEWFAAAVGALYQIGVVQGEAGGGFLPGSEISRQQAASLAMRTVAYRLTLNPDDGTAGEGPPSGDPAEGEDPAAGDGQEDEPPTEPGFSLMTDPTEAAIWLQGFRDRGAIASTHSLSVANALRAGVISGSTDQRFYPFISLTRAQAAGILYEALVAPLVMSEAPAPVEAEAAYPTLKKGATGPVVAWLERRLAALSYRPGAVDGVYDSATTDAVMAFQKVERLQRNGTATDAVQRRLVGALTPSARKSPGGTRVEIDLTRQVLFLVKAGRVESTIPIASGAEGTRTPTGTFSIQRKLPYWRESHLGLLYKPSYFYGGYAIHGSHSVPAYPASHGCVRVAVSTMDWLYPLLPIGTRVDIYF